MLSQQNIVKWLELVIAKTMAEIKGTGVATIVSTQQQQTCLLNKVFVYNSNKSV